MGASFPLFSRRNSPDSQMFSSQTNPRKPHKQSQFRNHQNSYIELHSKYQLSNQRWTTIRQYQKLGTMVMRNFSKSFEKGKSRTVNTTGVPVGDFDNSVSEKRKDFCTLQLREEDYRDYYPPSTLTKHEDFPSKYDNTLREPEKLADFLDHSNQLLIGQEQVYEGEESIRNYNESVLEKSFAIARKRTDEFQGETLENGTNFNGE